MKQANRYLSLTGKHLDRQDPFSENRKQVNQKKATEDFGSKVLEWRVLKQILQRLGQHVIPRPLNQGQRLFGRIAKT